MKTRTIALALIASFGSLTGYAQLKGGIKAGLNIASLKGDYGSNVNGKQKLGFHAGVTAEYPFANPKLALVGELLFSTQGRIIDESFLVSNNGIYSYQESRNTLTTANINVPIMLRYYVLERLSIQGGPQFGFAVKAEEKIETSNTLDPSQNETRTVDVLKGGSYQENGVNYPYEKTIKPFDMGINLGATYDVSDAFFIQLHYYFGLTDIDSRPAQTFLINQKNDFKNTVFQVSLGYKFF